MASLRAHLTAFLVRRRVKPALGDMRDLARVRAVFNKPLPRPRGAVWRDAVVGGVPGEWVEAAGGQPASATLLYLHGGGFVGCSPATHRPITAALARQGLRVFVPDYRLAPEHPFPAALDDVRAVWAALCAAAATDGGRLVVAGDSAGGNLALALMLALRDAGQALPDAAALFSPATDLSGGSPSLLAHRERDAMFDGPALQQLADAYLAGADAAQPLASPLLGELHGLPPLLLHVGNNEVLRDDALRLATKARAAGVTVQLQVWPVVPHVWQLLAWLPEARQSLRLAARHLREAVPATAARPQHVDVLIIGAGLSGIGTAVHLQRRGPEQRYAILESRPAMGGTWDLFRYPGVRSDSDMYTLGYAFKPWANPQAIADGPAIRHYIQQTAAENGVDAQIRYGHRLLSANWSSAEAHWRVEVELVDSGRRLFLTTGMLDLCSGYYRYDQGYRPVFEGEQDFRGALVHPQHWPQDLDYAGKQVVVIGSGATAVTLVPAMAASAAQVTMLQRSPSYLFTLPGRDALAEGLKRRLPAMLAYRLVRLKNIALAMLFFNFARRWPDRARRRLQSLVRAQLPAGYDMARHFTPHYKPWDQRVCLVPDGDFFQAIRAGRAEVVTDQIERFTAQGIRLASGRELPADIIVTATGLQLNAPSEVRIAVDGEAVDFSQTMVYKGMMYSGVPNLINTFGYTNASWTLKADLTAGYLCRLLRHMARHGLVVATPQADAAVQPRPYLDFSSGYVQRALADLPKQGDRQPWRLYQNYLLDLLTLRFGRLADGTLQLRPRPDVKAPP